MPGPPAKTRPPHRSGRRSSSPPPRDGRNDSTPPPREESILRAHHVAPPPGAMPRVVSRPPMGGMGAVVARVAELEAELSREREERDEEADEMGAMLARIAEAERERTAAGTNAEELAARELVGVRDGGGALPLRLGD